MANNQPSEQEIQFRKRARRRLVGAIALALLMVTVLPMMLDEQDTPPAATPEISINIPSQDSEDFSSRIVPVDPADEAEPQSQAQAGDDAGEPSSAGTGKAEGASTQPQAGEYVVQIGVYSDAGNAKKLQQNLAAKGLKIYSERLKADGGVKTRLRMGPYAGRAEADKALASLKAAGVNGIVMPK